MTSSSTPPRAGRVVVAMSGGVDSSVAALLLRDAGQDVVGLFMRNGVKVGAAESARKSCCSASDARDARMVAAKLGIPFQAVDLSEEFGAVIGYFLAQYARGRTPNPCVVCNRDLKLSRLLELGRELGADSVATGHYCRLELERGRVRLRRGRDPRKDQSYQMLAVSEEHLARARFPIGDLEKTRVRELAAAAGLRTASKADSQEICFVPGDDYRTLLAERGVELHPGELVDTQGRVLGDHPGTEHFTIGQRRGHGIGGGERLYVVALEPHTGTVVLGPSEECLAGGMEVRDLNWIGFDPPASGGMRAEVQVRYQHPAAAAEIELDRDRAEVVFDQPQLAIAPGQGAAFYRGDLLLGGGWIEKSTRPRARSAAHSVGAA